MYKVLDEQVETASGYFSIGIIHLAKGLELRAVAVMACDDEVPPLDPSIWLGQRTGMGSHSSREISKDRS